MKSQFGCGWPTEQLTKEVRAAHRMSLADSVEALESSAKSWAGGRLDDDLSILALEITGG